MRNQTFLKHRNSPKIHIHTLTHTHTDVAIIIKFNPRRQGLDDTHWSDNNGHCLMSPYYVPVTVQSYWHIIALNWYLQQFCEVGLKKMHITRWGNGYLETTGLAARGSRVQTQGTWPQSSGLTITYIISLAHESISYYFHSIINHYYSIIALVGRIRAFPPHPNDIQLLISGICECIGRRDFAGGIK